MLRPYAHLHATSFYGSSLGSVVLYAGLVALALGEQAAAITHLEAAVADNSRMGLRVHLAKSQLALSEALGGRHGRSAGRHDR